MRDSIAARAVAAGRVCQFWERAKERGDDVHVACAARATAGWRARATVQRVRLEHRIDKETPDLVVHDGQVEQQVEQQQYLSNKIPDKLRCTIVL
jgi:nicotinic acid mononucleotide adenylyltransferase